MVRPAVIRNAALVTIVATAASLANPEYKSIDNLMPAYASKVAENAKSVNRGGRYAPVVFAISYGEIVYRVDWNVLWCD